MTYKQKQHELELAMNNMRKMIREQQVVFWLLRASTINGSRRAIKENIKFGKITSVYFSLTFLLDLECNYREIFT